MEYKEAEKYIKDQLRNKLSTDLYYHGLEHTLDVLGATKQYCRMEDISNNEQLLVQTAALFHDAGMIETYLDHEEASVKLAKESLPGFGYTAEQISVITRLIMTTKLPQNAESILEKILCDSDLDYLGRKDFFVIAEKLRYEWNILNINPTTLKEWYEIQLEFLSNHEFYTASARMLRNKQKTENLNQIKELMAQNK
ncbi:MAG: HD domain-containing protein [Bacteroidales bacterium]